MGALCRLRLQVQHAAERDGRWHYDGMEHRQRGFAAMEIPVEAVHICREQAGAGYFGTSIDADRRRICVALLHAHCLPVCGWLRRRWHAVRVDCSHR